MVLSPGQILYVPAGFPHTTDTISINTSELNEKQREEEHSVHMTVGVDTHIWSLNFAGLRELCYRRSNTVDKLILTKLPFDSYWNMQVLYIICE